MLSAGVNWTLRSCRHLLRGDAKAMLLALRRGAEKGLDDDAVAKLKLLFAEIAAAEARLVALAEVGAYSPSQRASLPARRTVWRRLAAETSSAIGMLETQVKSRLAEVYAQDAGTLRLFLRLTAEGDSAAVDEFGVIHLSELRQRRRAPRTEVDCECEAILPTGSQSARLKDVSRNRLGIVRHGPLAEGQSAAMALPGGRRLEAIVVRRQGANAGMSLPRPPVATDPLFRSQAAAGM